MRHAIAQAAGKGGPERTEFIAGILKALGDPVRWDILAHVAQVDEFPCASLEAILPVSKPTISYHVKILQQAGLISVRKSGRSNYYAIHREAVDAVMDALWGLATSPGVEDGQAASDQPAPPVEKPANRRQSPAAAPSPVPGSAGESTVLTW